MSLISLNLHNMDKALQLCRLIRAYLSQIISLFELDQYSNGFKINIRSPYDLTRLCLPDGPRHVDHAFWVVCHRSPEHSQGSIHAGHARDYVRCVVTDEDAKSQWYSEEVLLRS